MSGPIHRGLTFTLRGMGGVYRPLAAAGRRSALLVVRPDERPLRVAPPGPCLAAGDMDRDTSQA
ncbi:MAG: hypothetical protein ACYDD6_07900 [Acidimicrobiales bacterium]